MVWGLISGLIGGVVKIVANVSQAQRDYLDWRNSDDGKKYFSRQEDNAFWSELAKGNTAVLDGVVADKQKRIEELKRITGICILVAFLGLTAGCNTYSVPDSIPVLSRDALTSNEVTYVVTDMKVATPDGKHQTLYGMWHVVSPDFVKTHVRNQDDLIKALEVVQTERKNDDRYLTAFLVILGIWITLWLIAAARRK